jgi:filamentous hemagglutinin family protein
MAADATEAAKTLYDYAVGDPTKIAEIQAAYNSAVSGGLLTKGGTADVTMATKNGITYQKTIGLSETQRISAMRIALACLAANTRPSSRTIARFN